MKRNHLVKVQKIAEINSGETYWDWFDNAKRKNANEKRDKEEGPFANPDVLPESEGFYYQDPERLAELKEKAEIMAQAMAEVLTPLERKVIVGLAGGLSLAQLAKAQKKSKSAIQQTQIRARAKLQRYAIRKGV